MIGEDENGFSKSYTEMEFDYAKRVGKPILAFVCQDIENLPGRKLEAEEKKREKLQQFRKKVMDGRLIKEYSGKDNLKAHVVTSLTILRKMTNSGGWIRAEDAKREKRNWNSIGR